MPGVRHIDVSAEFDGQRIDNYLRRELKGVPKTRLYRLLRRGEVRVNGHRVRPDYRLQTADRLRLPPVRDGKGVVRRPSGQVLRRLEGAILYEDDRLIVIDKPSGLAAHAGTGVGYGVVEAMRVLRPDASFLDLAHRLDRDTSGCLLIAKRRSTLRHLHALLREGLVEKRYRTLLAGRLPENRRVVEAPLGRRRGAGGESFVRVSPDGKRSRSIFHMLGHPGNDWTLAEVVLETGRMHQIRVHAAHIGHPVAGDGRYGDEAANTTLRRAGLRRLFLHAARLRFETQDGGALDVSAPLPDDLGACLQWLDADHEEGST